ncbi:MAG: hypothetical protein WD097_04510 [Balneolales bacterium]
MNNHLSRQLVQAYQQKSVVEGSQILEGIEDLLSRTRKIMDKADKKGKDFLALNAIKEARGSYELLSKIAYALHQSRLAELELEQTKQGSNEQQDQIDAQESLQVLDEDELAVFEKLTRKIRTQNTSIKCLPKEYRNTTLRMELDDDSGNWQIQEDEPEPTFRRTKVKRKQQREPEPSPVAYQEKQEPEPETDQEDEPKQDDEQEILGYTESGYIIRKPYPEDHPHWNKKRRELLWGISQHNKRH